MGITNELTREPGQAGDGAETEFVYSFKIMNESDIDVYLLNDDGTETLVSVNDYTVAGVGDTDGGTVTFDTAPDSDETVYVVRNRSIIGDYTITSTTVTTILDNIYTVLLRLLDMANRALKKNVTDKTYFSAESLKIKNLANGTESADAVTYGQMSALINAALADSSYLGAWATSTAYSTGDVVSNGSSTYYCISAHTSGASSEPGVGGSWETYWVSLSSDYLTDAELAAIAGLTSAANKIILFTGSGTATLLDFVDEDNMASDSATALSSQQAIKAYVDSLTGAASTTASGVVELATIAETDTGTDTGRVVTPDGLAGSYAGKKSASMVVFAAGVDMATGDGAAYFNIPANIDGMDLVGIFGRVITAGTTGTCDVQLHNVTQAQDMLSTKLTIDSGETGSDTAATAAVINTSNDDVAENDLIRVDIDAVHSTPAQGLILSVEFQLP